MHETTTVNSKKVTMPRAAENMSVESFTDTSDAISLAFCVPGSQRAAQVRMLMKRRFQDKSKNMNTSISRADLTTPYCVEQKNVCLLRLYSAGKAPHLAAAQLGQARQV
jgi:hypothetical protein